MPEKEIDTKGGAFIGKDVDTEGGDFVGRDKTITKTFSRILNLDGNVVMAIVVVLVACIITIVAITNNRSNDSSSAESPTAPLETPNLFSIKQLGPSYDKAGGGSDGGSKDEIACPKNRVATGLVVRAGSFIDAIGLQCSHFTIDGNNDGTEKSELIGGSGGKLSELNCASNHILIGVNGMSGQYLDKLGIGCQSVDGKRTSTNGQKYEQSGDLNTFLAKCDDGYVITGIVVHWGVESFKTGVIYRVDLKCAQFR